MVEAELVRRTRDLRILEEMFLLTIAMMGVWAGRLITIK